MALDLLRSVAIGPTTGGDSVFPLQLEIRQLTLAPAIAPIKMICTVEQIEEKVGEIIDLTRDVRPRQEADVIQNVADQELWKLNVRELPHLYVYRPTGGVWPDQVRRLIPSAISLPDCGTKT